MDLISSRGAVATGPRGHGGVQVRGAQSRALGAAAVVRELRAALGDEAALVLVFVPTGPDLQELAAELTAWSGPRIVACTSAGGIGAHGYAADEVVAVGLFGDDLQVTCIPLTPLDDLPRAWAAVAAQTAAARRQEPGRSSCALMVVDGLSRREEVLAEQAMEVLGGIPLIGGSAGDDLRFAGTSVLIDGTFRHDAAMIAVVSTSAPWRRFRVQHHVAGDEIAVVTAGDAAQRLVHELNGLPAAEEYARMVGVPVDRLTPTVFSTHPLLLRAGGGEWVRSISTVEPDGSLRFQCAADPGSVLRLGVAQDPQVALRAAIDDLQDELGTLSGVLVFDCILRRLEFEETGTSRSVGEILASIGAVGFSTYGEQFDAVHVNQTLVGIAFGG